MLSTEKMTIIAHCGACTELADNSWDALNLAVAEGADMVELDLRRSADGGIVVLHDATTYRMMGNGGTVAEMDLSQIRTLRGPLGERIATLDEVLRLPIPIIHEFKVPGLEEELADALKARPDDIVSSFDHASLKRVKDIDPAIKLGFLWQSDDWRSEMQKAVHLGAYSIHPSNYDVCPEMVSMAKDLGLKVNVWTVDHARRAAVLRDWGVDGIMTYAPQRTRGFLALT